MRPPLSSFPPLLACLLLAALPLQRAAAQQPALSDLPTSELRARIEALLTGRKYGELIAPIQEYIKRLEENPPQPDQQTELERLNYTLGFCYFMENKHQEAADIFTAYLEKYFDRNLTRTGTALDILANTLFSMGRYDDAAPLFERIMTRKQTPPARVREARALLAECYVLPGNWQKAIPFLEEQIKDRSDLDFYGQCVVYLCMGYVETEQIEKVFELLPDLEQSGSVARYSVAFNLSLLRGADRLYDSGRVDLALPLFLTVSPKRLIETWLEEQTALARGRREAAKAGEGEAAAAVIVAANERLRRLENEAKQLENVPSYDEELRHRIAQSYFRQSRTWEALWIYESIMEDFPESAYGQEAAYAGFALAASLGLLERAADFGAQYIERYPEGKYFDDVSHQLAQIYLEMRRFPEVLEVARAILDKRPDSLFADKLVFLSGFSLFQQEKFAEAEEMFSEIRRRYPRSDIVADAEYWKGMTFLFRSDYERALDQFRAVSSAWPATVVGIDAKFRSAVCLYALEKYGEARALLDAFVREHPLSPQIAEARILLGDIAGADGRLDEALAHYRSVESLTLNQAQIDYAALQAARVLETQEKFAEMEQSLRAYLEKYGTTGHYAEAIYRIGQAQRAQHRPTEMLETFRRALREYGNDRRAVGMDLILRDYVKEYTSQFHEPPDEEARRELAQARAKGLRTLALRWQMALDQIHAEHGVGAATPPDLKPDLLDDASAAVMVWIANTALAAGNTSFAREAFERSLKEFPDTEWNEPALLTLARMARDEGDPETAISYYEQLRKAFPSSQSAALALEEQARILMEQGKHREAVPLLEMILDVKEWRGEIWARALFLIGEAKLAMGETAEAFAYFQRVYVLYAGYKEWAAKAYLESAKCLKILGKDAEREATLREFLANEDYKDLPEYAKAAEIAPALRKPSQEPAPAPQ